MRTVAEPSTAEKQADKKTKRYTNYLVMSLPVVDQLVEYQIHVYSCRAAVSLGVIADGRKALVASLEYATGYQVDAGRERLVYAVTLTER